MLDDVGSRERRNFCGVIGRAVIHDDDLFGVLLRPEDDRTDRRAFVERGNRHQDAQRFGPCGHALAGRGNIINDRQEIPPWG